MKGAGNRHAFNWIIVELFSRKLTPEYDKSDSEHNKYLTWVTAQYRIRAVRKVTDRQVKYIIEHKQELENKIRINGKPKPELFGLPL